MNDNDLLRVLIAVLATGFATRGIACAVKQAYQPTQQGGETGPALHVFKLSDHRYGWTSRRDVWNNDTGVIDHTEAQIVESLFQAEALSVQDPTDVSALTASDLAHEAAAILSSRAALDMFLIADVGIERITDVRNPYFKNENNQNQAAPSFDFTLTHKRVTVIPGVPITTYESNIKRV